MENQNELDLLELFHYLKKKIPVLLAVALIGGMLGFLGTKLFIPPKYTASTRVYVLNRASEGTVVSSDFSLSNYMVTDYQVLITGRNVTEEVAKRLNLDLTDQELSEMIRVTAPDNTRVLQISVTDTDARRAADIANQVRDVAMEQIKQIMAVDAVNLVYAARIPEELSSPNVWKNAAVAALLGLSLAAGICVTVFLLDDTVRTEDDVQRYLGLSTVGVIPLSDELNTMTRYSGKKRKSGKRGLWHGKN